MRYRHHGDSPKRSKHSDRIQGDRMTVGNGVLVTGGAGFIGSALSRVMARTAERWVVIDNLHPQIHSCERPRGLDLRAELVVGDIEQPGIWDSVLRDFQPKVVVHLAAETGTAQSLTEASRHARVNVLGTAVMLDAFARNGQVPSHFVLASSRAVYGEGRWEREDGTIVQPGVRSHAQLARGEWDIAGARPLPSSAADTPARPTSVYGATKLAQEHILSAWTASNEASLSIARLQNVYGPGQSLTNSYTGIVTLFSRLARAGRSIPLYEDGLVVRDFIYIDDVVRAIRKIIDRKRIPENNEIFDVGSGVLSTISSLADTVARLHGAPSPHVSGRFRDGDVRFAACDVGPTERALDWRSRVDLSDGVALLQEWIDKATIRTLPDQLLG